MGKRRPREAKKPTKRQEKAQPTPRAAPEGAPSNPRAAPATIVGIGASAGGLAALKKFFAHTPADTGFAFVVVVHLSPDHESHLAELLQPHLGMPIQQVTETVALEPNRVYIIPPGANLNTIDTHLRLSKLEERRQERAPIDHFFRTLAGAHDGEAIGVILTGTGSDGTLGLKEIKQKGGLTVVQDPNEAEYDGMPQSAIATGLVDLVLPLEAIPAALVRYSQIRPELPELLGPQDSHGDLRQSLRRVFAQLSARTNRDFSRYKQSTILRRIQRRMRLAGIEQLSDYLAHMRDNADEVNQLADDLLITVTSFFRDGEVFAKLEASVVPGLFDGKTGDDEIRVWSVGCATGEEAYSLTMLLMEEAERREHAPTLRVFASDLHEHSLAKARDGFYPGDIAGDMSSERLTRFFIKENGGYRIRKEVRELVVFAPHNLLSDPPFSRMDFVSCRNVLIYIQRELQRDILGLFHYALRPDGYLLLGPSETVETSELFRVEDKRACIFQKRNVPGPKPRLPVFPLTQMRLPHRASPDVAGEPHSYGPLHEKMVEQYGPPSILVGPDDCIVHISEHAGRYLALPGGEPTTSVFKLVREELRIELRSAVPAARQSRNPIRTRAVTVRLNGDTASVVLDVRAALDAAQVGFVLIMFDERADHAAPPEPARQASSREAALDNELELLHKRLQALVEEFDTSREEMRASNEEMQSTNEELRSTMEELETSKEELQSMNEELQTVNQENRHKVEELAQLSSDLQNLLSATDIATLFLDRQFRIMRFTPKLGEIFNIRLADRGRPISDLTHHLGYSGLEADARHVLDRLIPVEREVSDESDEWYLTRVLPYRSVAERVEGVVITFVDITSRKRAERALRDNERRLAAELQLARGLQEISENFIRHGTLQRLYEQALDVAVDVMRSDFGSLQLARESEPPGGGLNLELMAWHAFHPHSAEFWKLVGPASSSACGEALRTLKRCFIPDVAASDLLAGSPDLDEARRSGIGAVQSTPLMARSGALLGVLSTHWRAVHEPCEEELGTLDLLARQMADLLEWAQATEAVRYRTNQVQTMFERSPLGVYLVDAQLRIREVNPVAQPIFNRFGGNVLGWIWPS